VLSSFLTNEQLKKLYDEESRRALSLSVKLDDAMCRAQRAGMWHTELLAHYYS